MAQQQNSLHTSGENPPHRRSFSYLLHSRALLACTLSILLTAVAFAALCLLFPLPKDQLQRPSSTLIYDRSNRLLRAFTASDDTWRMRCDPNELSPLLIKMVLAYEDRWFRWHPGINPVSILRATITNVRSRKVVCGGSTLTMQIARMMEPKERNLNSKVVEVFRALQLELFYSKDELLETYFNLAPYGGNIEGIASAAQLYFGKSVSTLSVGEIALLTALPNSPTKLRPDVHPEQAREARDKVLKRLREHGTISAGQYADALSEPVPTKRQPMPFRAPHLARLLRKQYPDRAHITSTIDLRIQDLCLSALRQHLSALRPKGIANGAVVMLDNRTRTVLAMVGSGDFFEEGSSGQVDGALAPRSPGSALKPFVYAAALDQGLISERSILEDVPVDYSGYRPVNYDEKYHGVVTVRDALMHSLNVPAINLCAALEEKSIYSLLKRAGLSTLGNSQESYGLPLILGACEVNLLELTNLYAALANGGLGAPARLVSDAPAHQEGRLFSEASAFIVREILSEVARPDLPSCWEFSLNLPKVSWKTGTSYGHKDAWSIGCNPEYTIGVWVGNFSGKGAPAIVGAEVAAPILFDLFNAVTVDRPDGWFEMPDTVERRLVCALSGMPAQEICPTTTEEWYIPEVSPWQTCAIHTRITVDEETGYRLCPHCRQGRKTHHEVMSQWPAKLATWMERTGYPVDRIPPHYPPCTSLIAGQGPVIRSPSERCEYLLREGIAADYQKILLDASVSNNIENIFWFVDGELLYSGSVERKVFYTPTPGKHTLICMDELGRSSKRMLQVW
ncbi:MAG: penicillin-binding protein 1C [Candidatus Latescibacterota bacterium]